MSAITQLTFELFRDVETCVQECDGDIEAGFEEAEDEDLARDDLKERLAEANLSKSEVRAIELSVMFQEFDSSNWTHAQACFHVSMKVPAASIERVRKAFAQELEV